MMLSRVCNDPQSSEPGKHCLESRSLIGGSSGEGSWVILGELESDNSKTAKDPKEDTGSKGMFNKPFQFPKLPISLHIQLQFQAKSLVLPRLSWVVRMTCSCWPGGPNVKYHSGSWARRIPPKLVVIWEVIEPLGGRVWSGEVHQWEWVLRFYSLVPLPLSFSVSCLVKCDQFLTATPAPAAMPSPPGCTVCQNC